MESQTERICPICGKSFMPVRDNNIYCGHKCACKGWWKNNPEAMQDKKKNKPVYKRVCLFCGREFETTRANKKCCSLKCSWSFQSKKQYARIKQERMEKIRKAREQEKISLVKKLLRKYRRKCPGCGVKFYALHREFCCEECRDEYFDNMADGAENRSEYAY